MTGGSPGLRAGSALAALAALSGAVAVATGAFGAHALSESLTPARLETWRTASTYALGHAPAALVASALAAYAGSRPALWAARLFLAGTALFSGSLWALVLADAPWLGIVAPFGGASFIAGWLALAWALRRVGTDPSGHATRPPPRTGS